MKQKIIYLYLCFLGMLFSLLVSCNGKAKDNVAFESNNNKAYIDSIFNLGQAAMESKNYKEALEYFEEGDKYNHAPSQNCIGLMYQMGDGVEQNSQLAAKWFKKAADNDLVNAKFYLGVLLIRGEGIENDIPKGLEYINLASESGFASAQTLMARLYTTGLDGYIIKDEKQAVELYKKAAEQHEINALQDLALGYYEGSMGLIKNDKTAAYYYKIGADEGDPLCQYNYGYFLLTGTGIDKNSREGISYMQKAANQGYQPAIDRLKNAEIEVLKSSKGEFDLEVLIKAAYKKGFEDGDSGYAGWDAVESFDNWLDNTVGKPQNKEQKESRKKYRGKIYEAYLKGLEDGR